MSSSGSNATCDRSIDDRKKENFSFLESVTTVNSEVQVQPPVVIQEPVKAKNDEQPPPPPPPLPPQSQPAVLLPQPTPETSPQTPPKDITPSTPSPCLYVRFEAEAFHLTHEQNNLPQGDPGLRTFGDFTKRFVSGDEQTIKNVMCKYWSVKKINGVPVSKQDASGNLLNDKMYRVTCDKAEIATLITAFKRYEAYLESPENKAELDTKQHFNPAAQIEYVKVYLQRLTNAQTNMPKDCIGLHETIPSGSASSAGGDGTDRYYGVLPKVFYLLYNQSKTGQPLKAQELLNTYSSLTQDPDELLKTVADDKGLSSHSDIFEPVPVSILALMNLISEKFPHIYKLKMGTGTGLPDAQDAGDHTSQEETYSDPNEIKNGLADILDKVFEKDEQAKKAVQDNFIEAHDKYHKKDTKGAISSIHNALTKIVDHLKASASHTDTLSMSTAGEAPPLLKPVQAIPGQDLDKDELAKKDSEIANLKAQLVECSGKSKACDEKISGLEAQKAALEGEKSILQEELKKYQSEPKADPAKVAGIELEIAKATSDLESLTKELDVEKAKSAECNTELAAVKAKNTELEKQLADSTTSKNVLSKRIAELEANNTDPAELQRLREQLNNCETEKGVINEELRKNVSEVTTLRSKITALEVELKALRNTGSQSEADKARITELESQLEAFRNERAEYQKKMEKVVKDLNDRINIILDEKSIIEKRLKIVEGEKGVSDTESTRLRGELAALNAELDKSRIDMEKYKTSVEIQIKDLHSEIDRIIREKTSMQQGKGESDKKLAA
jgi:predicted  nucleic acid-binding Zn-ribbon protein